MRSIRRAAITFGRLDRALAASGAVVGTLDAPRDCRAMIGGSDELRRAASGAASASRRLLTTIRGASSARVVSSRRATRAQIEKAGDDAGSLVDALAALDAAQQADLRIDSNACARAAS